MSAQTSFLDDLDTFNSLCQYWQKNHGAYVECLRAHALRIAARSKSDAYPNGRVTIDDLRDEIAAFKLPMPTQIGADDRMFGMVLRGCRDLCVIGIEKTRRADWAKRVGVTRSMISVYAIKEKPSRSNATA